MVRPVGTAHRAIVPILYGKDSLLEETCYDIKIPTGRERRLWLCAEKANPVFYLRMFPPALRMEK
jgi:hypothetical protein